MKKTGLNGYVCYFIVYYDAIAVGDILDIYKYFVKKKRYYKIFGFVKQIFVSAMTFLVVM